MTLVNHTIELKKVSKYYASEDQVSMGFARVDLELDMGEFVVITGESGSGKSTLLNIISGLDSYDEGEMFVCGEDTTGYTNEDYERYRKTYIGNIFQDFNLVGSYTVYQNVELVMLANGREHDECRARVDELIEQVGLKEQANTKVSKLSGGQKQRVAIARALAKDAPVIVADEPTGNLDSESADLVMKTLAEASEGKLVIIVTHNYEQAEPYATRKLTMHDGRIIEDKHIDRPAPSKAEKQAAPELANQEPAEEIAEETEGEYSCKDMKRASETRLGLRNTFNIASKFFLLLIVYVFVVAAVLGQYASVKNSMHEDDMLGINQYFLNTDSARVVVTKDNGKAFSEKDIERLSKNEHVKRVIADDVGIDTVITYGSGTMEIKGPFYPVEEITAKDLTYGRMPTADNEIVVSADPVAEAYLPLVEAGEKALKLKEIPVCGVQGYPVTAEELSVVGVIIDNKSSYGDSEMFNTYCKIYVRDNTSREILANLMAAESDVSVAHELKTLDSEGMRYVFPLKGVAKGEAIIGGSLSTCYDKGNAKGKTLNISVENRCFSSGGSFKVAEVLDDKNYEKLLGVSTEEGPDYSDCVLISEEDFNELFNKGYYQISIFADNDNNIDKIEEAFVGKGYNFFAIKDSLTDVTGGFSYVIDLMSFGLLILELIVLFFIAYAVIKIIMKSRNSYYAILRLLGANKSNTDRILKVELVLMMIIAYIVVLVPSVLIKLGYIDLAVVKKQLYFINPLDWAILFLLMLAMSVLIANRYARRIFGDTAMNSLRREVSR